MSPRGANPKFQGGVVLGGIERVAYRMAAVKELSDRLKLENPLLTSVHLLHEMKTSQPEYMRFNNPNAITFADLKQGIKSGCFPQILAITAPAFGFKGIERGAILSPDKAVQKMARSLHIEAIERAQELEEDGCGKGVAIWWPAFDTRRLDLLDGSGVMDEEKALEIMKDFWVDVLEETNGCMWLEWKVSDPGVLDYIWTLGKAIKFCISVNEALGRNAMFINNEWAHLLIGGVTVREGTQSTIDAGLFTGFVHVNSAQLFPVNIEKEMADADPQTIPSGIDWDWAVGIGGDERWEDQEKAVEILDNCPGVETIFAEHDINPAGQDPVSFAELSIRNLQKMLDNIR